MTAAARELVNASREVVDRLFISMGNHEDAKTLYNTVTLLEKYLDLTEKASDTMKAASEEIVSLREQLQNAKTGSALLALEESESQIEHLLKVIKAMDQLIAIKYSDSARVLATSVFANSKYRNRSTKIV